MKRFVQLFTIVLFLVQSEATTLEYQVTVLDALPDAEYSYAIDINNHGQVVGRTRFRAFYWDSQRGVIDVGQLPGAEFSTPTAINDQGQVVGYSGYHAFIWTADTGMQRLVGLPDDGSTAGDINDSGSVVGWNSTSALYWDPVGGVTDLGERVAIPGYHPILANAINNNGQIAGIIQSLESTNDYLAFFLDRDGAALPLDFGSHGRPYYVADLNDPGDVAVNVWTLEGFRAYMWNRNEGVIELGFFPDSFETDTHIAGINNVGQAVGRSSNRPFVWDRDSGLQRLDEAVIKPARTIAGIDPIAINDSGAIVGSSYSYVHNETRVVVLTPIPEPASVLAAFAAFFVVVLVVIYRSRPIHSLSDCLCRVECFDGND